MSIQKQSRGLGDFFQVDRRAFARACDLGLLAAVAYLVIARGTGRDNRTSRWSVHSICQYSGMSRSQAGDAVRLLLLAGLLKEQARTGGNPTYHLVPAHEFLADCRASLDPTQQRVLIDIEAASALPVMLQGDRLMMARALAYRGVLEEVAPHYFTSVEPREATAPQWIWLPNALVDGAASERSPIRLLRETQSLSTLRILAFFYENHDLIGVGGLRNEIFFTAFEGRKVAEIEQYNIWEFEEVDQGDRYFRNEALFLFAGDEAAFFSALRNLQRLGLIVSVPHLFDGDPRTGSVIHPLDIGGDGEVEETEITDAADSAARALLKRQELFPSERGHLVPILAHIGHARVAGVTRLRYRPRTRATAAWYGPHRWVAWRDFYQSLAVAAETGGPLPTSGPNTR